jgi:hypothetical protein
MWPVAHFVYRRFRRFVPAWRTRHGAWLPEPLLSRVDARGLFIHIPKNAGNSVCHALYGMRIYHRPAWEIRLFHPIRYRRWFKFAVVRDPIDRFLSAYDFLLLGGKNGRDAAFRDKYLKDAGDINAFVRSLKDLSIRREVTAYFHFRPQFAFVSAAQRVIVNRLVPFERMNADIPSLTGGAGLERINTTRGARTSASTLTTDSLEILRDIYQVDVKLHALAMAAQGSDVFGTMLP